MSSKSENQTAINGSNRHNEMLTRLQESAIPEPIRVACTVVPRGKPEYLGEEYHGCLTKNEDRKLLEGKSGRFIIRDIHGAPRANEFTIVFNYAGDIQYVRLVYNPLKKTFKTDPSDKEYKSVLLLMTDVLFLFHKLKKTQADEGKKNRKGYSKPHKFFQHTYLHPKWCDHCKEFLWGLVNQGFKCEDCGISVHKFCKDIIRVSCAKVELTNKNTFGRYSTFEGEDDDEALNSSKRRGVLPAFHIKCLYFRSCSQFLSAFNIRDIYIDMNSSSTRCFCAECFENNSISNSDNSEIVFPSWTIHKFVEQGDPLKRATLDWKVAYLAVKPMHVVKLISDCFEPPDSNNGIDLLVASSFENATEDIRNEDYFYKYVDSSTGDNSYAQCVLQFYVEPGSYKQIHLSHTDHSFISNSDVEGNHLKIPNYKHIYPKSILLQISKEKINGAMPKTQDESEPKDVPYKEMEALSIDAVDIDASGAAVADSQS